MSDSIEYLKWTLTEMAFKEFVSVLEEMDQRIKVLEEFIESTKGDGK